MVLVPASHQLQLLVQDYNLEKGLRKQCEQFIKDRSPQKDKSAFEEEYDLYAYIQGSIKPTLPLVDLSLIDQSSEFSHHPRLLADLCVGYLKIAQFDKSVK